MSSHRDQVVELPSAGVPADQGLSSLGLIMQLAGGLFAAGFGLMLVQILAAYAFAPRGMNAGSEVAWMFAVIGLCIARSALHRQAGTELLYGGRRNHDGTTASPLGALRRYVVLGLGQTVLLAIILKAKFEMPGTYTFALAAGLAVWPALLGALLVSGKLSRFEHEIPYAEDKGFEGASILMTVLGLCGALASGAILILLLKMPKAFLFRGTGMLIALATAALFLRSCIHVQAGLSGLRTTSIDRSVELASRYANWGIITAFGCGGAWLLVSMTSAPSVWTIALVAGMCWLLMQWPLIIRRFFSDRQFVDLLAGDQAAVHRRAPDAGLSGLGWLLVAHAVFGLTFLIPQLVADGHMPRAMRVMSMLGEKTASPWWSAGVIALQLWAGFELLRMGAMHKIASIVYGAAASLVTLYLMWPMMKALFSRAGGFRDEGMVISFAMMAIQLVLPVVTVLLVTRVIAPTARARYRRPDPG